MNSWNKDFNHFIFPHQIYFNLTSVVILYQNQDLGYYDKNHPFDFIRKNKHLKQFLRRIYLEIVI